MLFCFCIIIIIITATYRDRPVFNLKQNIENFPSFSCFPLVLLCVSHMLSLTAWLLTKPKKKDPSLI